MGNDISLMRKDLNDIKAEIALIREILSDDEAGLEVGDDVVKEVEDSRKQEGKDLVGHEEVFKKYGKWVLLNGQKV